MKVAKKVITIVLCCFIGLLLFINISALTSRNKHYGVPIIFGNSYLTVETDSMEPTLPVGTLIKIKEIKDFSTLEKNDIITYYRSSDKKIVTHRLMDINLNADGSYTLDLFGDNMNASSCPANDCTSAPHDFINSKYAIGKYVGQADGIGYIFSAMRNPLVSGLLIFIPGGYVVISSLIDFIKNAKNYVTEEALEKAETKHQQDLESIKEEAKRQALAEYEKERENKDKGGN